MTPEILQHIEQNKNEWTLFELLRDSTLSMKDLERKKRLRREQSQRYRDNNPDTVRNKNREYNKTKRKKLINNC